VILQSLSNAAESRTGTNDEQAGSVLLETIRLLTQLNSDERASLIGLLKAFE